MNEYEVENIDDFYKVAYVTPKSKEILEGLLRKSRNIIDIHSFLNEMYRNSERKISANVLKFELGEFEEKTYYAVCERNKNSSTQKWCLNKIVTSDDDFMTLKKYAYLGDESKFLDGIANLALNENWTYKGLTPNNEKNNVLKKHLNTTFAFLYEHKNVIESKDKKFSAFNTGLVDRIYDDIYLVFKNQAGGRKYLCCTTKRKSNGKYLDNFAKLPEKANFAKVADLFLIPGNIDSDFEHIFRDNFDRFPIDFIKRELSPVSEFNSFLGSHSDIYEIRDFILNNQDCSRRISSAFENSVDQSVRRWNWNYKTAVPMYFPTKKKIQFLLPLYFSTDTKKLDAALVIDKTVREQEYRGVTILTPAMAYLDARLLCRPDSDWLYVQ